MNINHNHNQIENNSTITFEPNPSNLNLIDKKSTINIPLQSPTHNSITILNDIITNPGGKKEAKEQY